MVSDGLQPCHKGHCHEPRICGGGWKDYRVVVEDTGDSEGAESPQQACAATLDAVAKKTQAQAAAKCDALHACGNCPERCTGCESQNPRGRVAADEAKTTTTRRADGTWQCAVEVPTTYRCRCSPCLVKGAVH